MNADDLDGISNDAKGMPDNWHIDGSGKSSAEVFQKRLGLPRQYRKDIKLVESAMHRRMRLRHFFSALLHYRHLSTAILLGGDKFASPEAQVLARLDEGWHLRNEQDLVEFAKLDDADRKVILADLREMRQAKDWKLQQVKVQALANRASITLDHAFEVVISCGVESWLRARNRLINWASLSSEDRALLADAIFCGFTIFGKRALQDACAIEPEVLSYYRAFLGLPTVHASASDSAAVHAMPPPYGGASDRQASTARPEPAAQVAKVALEATGHQVVDPSSMAPGATINSNVLEATELNFSKAPNAADPLEHDAPQSLSQLYLQIGMICQDAQVNPEVGAEPALRIKDLLDRHLHRLVERNAKLSGEEVSGLIDRYCSAVLHMTVVLDFANSEQRDLVPVLAAAWKLAVISALSEGRQQSWYETNLQQRQHLPALTEVFQEKTSKIAQARAEIESLKSQLAEAKY